MENSFFELSRQVANDFLQNIVFIDDKAFNPENNTNHHFNAAAISKAFGASKKICAVYKPENDEDIKNFGFLAQKSDITVLDWQILIESQKEKVDVNDEEDAEVDDPRGSYTKKIIEQIIFDPITGKDSLKLIIVYTGEAALYDITENILQHLQNKQIKNIEFERADCRITTENIKILVRAKPGIDQNENVDRFKHTPDLNDKVIEYKDLPGFVLDEFTKMTNGLLSNFVIRSLNVLRTNTFRLIKIFNREMDPSFLFHRLLLPHQEDSKEQLVEVLAHSLQALLNYNQVGEVLSTENIVDWIKSRKCSETIEIKGKTLTIDHEFLTQWVQSSFQNSCESAWVKSGYGSPGSVPVNKIKTFENGLFKLGTQAILGEGSNKDPEFSILTHHKSNFKQESTPPRLNLGSVIKECDGENYYLCIQAKCDSVRIKDRRRFLFLQLIANDSKFQIIIDEAGQFTRLQVAKDAYLLRTIKFSPTNGQQIILAESNGKQYTFSCD